VRLSKSHKDCTVVPRVYPLYSEFYSIVLKIPSASGSPSPPPAREVTGIAAKPAGHWSSLILPAPVAVIPGPAGACRCHPQSCQPNRRSSVIPRPAGRLSSLSAIAVAGVVVDIQYYAMLIIEHPFHFISKIRASSTAPTKNWMANNTVEVWIFPRMLTLTVRTAQAWVQLD